MAIENALAFLRGLGQNRPAAQVVLIAGPQAFLREYALEALRQRLARDSFGYRSFQLGGGDSFGAIINELEGVDLFAPRRLVVCRIMRTYRERGSDSESEEREATDGRSASDGDSEKALINAIERLAASVRLALVYERDNAPAKMRRTVEQAGAVVNCMRPFDNQIGQYVDVFARNLGLKLSLTASDLLAGRHGGDLSAIANALAKARISCGQDGKVEAADLIDAGAAHIPDLFELAESLARGQGAEALGLFDRAVNVGRDPIELLAVEIVPLLRRMLLAASLLARRRSASDIAAALGLPASSQLVTRAIDGARRFGLKRLEHAHQQACRLDANFKAGLIKERGHAVAGMLLELMAEPASTGAS